MMIRQEMSVTVAIEKLRTGDSYGAILCLTAAVAAHLDSMDIHYDTDSLQDWIAAGDYDGTETVASIATEWDIN